MKKHTFRAFGATLTFLHLISLPLAAEQWTAPVIPGADLDKLKSTETIYLCNIETGSFLTSGMTWNTNACAVRLPNGDAKTASAYACQALVSAGKVQFRLSSYASYFVSCLSEAANNIYVDQNSGSQFTYQEATDAPRTYVLTNTTYNHPLDVTWDYGGHVTLTDGGGHTRWAFIPADSITSGAWARYKARRALFNVQAALAASGQATRYEQALSDAKSVFMDAGATIAELRAASRALFIQCADVLDGPLDVSFLFENADMVGAASAANWTAAGVTFRDGEFEMYHKTLTLSQTAQVPAGLYDIVFHALYRNDGSDAAPLLTAGQESPVAVPVPLMNDLNYQVGNTNGSNGWTSGTSGLIPNDMRSCAQALTHSEAVARAENVVVQGGSLPITVSVTSTSQWFNWQGFEVIWRGSGSASLREALNEAIGEAASIVGKGSGKGADLLQAVIGRAEALYADADAPMSSLTAMMAELKEAVESYRYSAASVDFPYDVTSLLSNPDFEAGLKGWTNVGMAAQTNSSFTFKHGSTYVEKWVSSAGRLPEVSVSQTVTGLPCGIYMLSAAAHHITQNVTSAQRGAFIFAGSHEQAVTAAADYTLTFTHLGQPLTIGLHTAGPTGNWIACDNFRLYYIGGEAADFTTELTALRDEAEALRQAKASAVALAALDGAVREADEAILQADVARFASAATALTEAMRNVRSSAAAYEALADAITNATGVASATTQEAGREAFLSAIQAAQTLWESPDATEAALAEAVEVLKQATFTFRLDGGSGTPPTVVTDTRYARGSTVIFGRSTVTPASGSRIIERGFCWSQSPSPTVYDSRSTAYISNAGFIYKMEGLQPATRYYVRAYAISDTYAVGYGDVLKVYTIPAGSITWTYNNGGPADANERINAALAGGVAYWNRLTAIRGLRISCSYGSGTPTADCSYGGSMRIGPSSSYQQIGTVLHEMAHAAGVGTHPVWYDCAALRENTSRGYWLGDRTTDVLRFWDNDDTARLNGDNTHMWPYGINGAHEDLGTEALYTANGLIMQALGEDGLPPTGGFCTPAYVLDQEDTIRYYIRSESPAHGLSTSFLMENRLRSLKSVVLTPAEAAANDSCAWTITFNPSTGYYQFRNVGTGHFLSYQTSSGTSGFKMMAKETPGTTESFHLMRGRTDASMQTADATLPVRGYWIIHPENKQNPTCMAAASNGTVGTATFSLANSATSQRWVIISGETMDELIGTGISPQPSALGPQPSDAIFDLTGRAIQHAPVKGIYIVGHKKVLIR